MNFFYFVVIVNKICIWISGLFIGIFDLCFYDYNFEKKSLENISKLMFINVVSGFRGYFCFIYIIIKFFRVG